MICNAPCIFVQTWSYVASQAHLRTCLQVAAESKSERRSYQLAQIYDEHCRRQWAERALRGASLHIISSKNVLITCGSKQPKLAPPHLDHVHYHIACEVMLGLMSMTSRATRTVSSLTGPGWRGMSRTSLVSGLDSSSHYPITMYVVPCCRRPLRREARGRLWEALQAQVRL